MPITAEEIGGIIRVITMPVKEKPNEVIVTIGSSYFGSGGYSAGYKTISGKVIEKLIAGTHEDNGFMSSDRYLITPETPEATIKVWNGDEISNSGWRSLGLEGVVHLVQPDVETPHKICPNCGAILP